MLSLVIAVAMTSQVAWQTNGVIRKPKGREVYEATSPIAKHFVERATAEGGADFDDSKKPYITVIGTQEECDAVKRDIEGSGPLGKMHLNENYHINYFRPDSWQVKTIGLMGGGKPDIVIQNPPDTSGKGRVVYRQRDYSGGQEHLARAIAALPTGAVRQPNPDYDPSRDPAPGSSLCPFGFTKQDWGVIICAAIVTAILLTPTRKPQ